MPDLAVHRPGAARQWHPTAALVGEILSLGDETFEKFPFYAARGVDEILVVDPAGRAVRWHALDLSTHLKTASYAAAPRSGLIDLGSNELAERIDWP